MLMKISIEIDSEKEECNDLGWIRIQLAKVVDKLHDPDINYNIKNFGEDQGKILDFNGNSVGTWSIVK